MGDESKMNVINSNVSDYLSKNYTSEDKAVQSVLSSGSDASVGLDLPILGGFKTSMGTESRASDSSKVNTYNYQAERLQEKLNDRNDLTGSQKAEVMASFNQQWIEKGREIVGNTKLGNLDDELNREMGGFVDSLPATPSATIEFTKSNGKPDISVDTKKGKGFGKPDE